MKSKKLDFGEQGATLFITALSRNHLVTDANNELTRTLVPYMTLPPASSPPQTDYFLLNPPWTQMSMDRSIEIPLPGHVLQPGIPAPANAWLSLGLELGAPSTPTRQNQPTTTIRLISNTFSNVDFIIDSLTPTKHLAMQTECIPQLS